MYGDAQVREIYKTWDALKSIAGNSGVPWLALGDFNEVIHQYEHDGVNRRSQSQMDGFRDTLDICGLIDLGSKGRNWTYEKKVAGGSFTRVRLDRAVADSMWCSMFPAVEITNMAAVASDHGPIVVNLDSSLSSKKPRMFRYEQMWERHPDLEGYVEAQWSAGGVCCYGPGVGIEARGVI